MTYHALAPGLTARLVYLDCAGHRIAVQAATIDDGPGRVTALLRVLGAELLRKPAATVEDAQALLNAALGVR